MGYVYPNFSHRLDCQGIELPCFQSSAFCRKPIVI